MARALRWALYAPVIGIFLAGDPVSYVFHGAFSSTAEARVGRPATPVSVAGVARRTTRRCVVGVPPC